MRTDYGRVARAIERAKTVAELDALRDRARAVGSKPLGLSEMLLSRRAMLARAETPTLLGALQKDAPVTPEEKAAVWAEFEASLEQEASSWLDRALAWARQQGYPVQDNTAKESLFSVLVEKARRAFNEADVVRKPAGHPDGGQFADRGVETYTQSTPVSGALNGVAFARWTDAPTTLDGWRTVPGQRPDIEPSEPLRNVPGKKQGAGVVVLEPDGRAWVVEPTNHFGGYQHTFPKGTRDAGLTLQQTAIKEAFEESGLQVAITGHLLDVERDTSTARYYLARRVGGTPTAHGWESQAVKLVPLHKLLDYLNRSVDRRIAEALRRFVGKGDVEVEGSVEKAASPWVPWLRIRNMTPVEIEKDAAFEAKVNRDLRGRFARKGASGDRHPPGGGVSGFMAEFNEGSRDIEHPRWRAVERMAPDGFREARVYLYSTGSRVHVSELLAASRGGGRAAMQWMTELAEKHGVVMELYAEPISPLTDGAADLGAKMPRPKLVKWYKGFGFREVKDRPGLMIRHPKREVAEKSSLFRILTKGREPERWDADTPWAPSGPGPGRFKSSDILGERVGEQGGSNPGGVFVGKDGVKRYVKFYQNPVQGAAEHLANAIYTDLGLAAPNSLRFEHDGKMAFATEWIPNTKLLAAVELTPERARAILQGYAADVLTANWDAVGLEQDNIAYRNGSGRPIRLDQGGTFQFRAQGALKTTRIAPDDLRTAGEFQSLYRNNPQYRQVFEAAGLTPDTMGPLFTKGVQRIAKLRASLPDGWLGYVRRHVPDLAVPDQELMAQMLEGRTADLLRLAKVSMPRRRLRKADERWGSEVAWAPEGPAPGRWRPRAFAIASAMAVARRQPMTLQGILNGPDPASWPRVATDETALADRVIHQIEQEPLLAMARWKQGDFVEQDGVLSRITQRALAVYIGTDYERINDFLRQGAPGTSSQAEALQSVVRHLDDATRAWRLTEPVRAYRARRDLVEHAVGEYVHDAAFVSTSLSRRAALKFGALMGDVAGTLYRIGLSPGDRVAMGNEYESELVLPRRALFKVRRVRDVSFYGLPQMLPAGKVRLVRQKLRLVDLRYVGSGRHPIGKEATSPDLAVPHATRFEWREGDITRWMP